MFVKGLRVCYLNITPDVPTRDVVYMKGLKECGVQVIDIRDSSPGLIKFLKIYRRHKLLEDAYDIILVGYAAQILVPFARLISRKPIIFNALGTISKGIRSRRGRLSLRQVFLWVADLFAFHCADLNLIESETLIRTLTKEFCVSRAKLLRAWTGVDDSVFTHDPHMPKAPAFTVLFRGELANDSGIQYFVHAARQLASTDIHFRIIGKGPMAARVQSMLNDFDSKNVEWRRDWLETADLRRMMQECHVSVGWLTGAMRGFSSIPHKVFESLSLKVPVLQARLPAVQELLTEDSTGFFCNADDADDLARMIRKLRDDPGLLRSVAENAYKEFDDKLRPQRLAQALLNELKRRALI